MNISVLKMIATMALAGVAACTGTKNSANQGEEAVTKVAISRDSLDEALDGLDPEFVATLNGPGTYYFGMVTGGGGPPDGPRMIALRSIASVTFQVFTPDGRLIWAETTDRLTSSGVMNGETGEASVTMAANIEWTAPEPLPDGSYAVMTVRSTQGMIARRKTLATEERATKIGVKPIVMLLESHDMGSGVEFILHVERLAPASASEYLPSGEQYRIELESEVGETLWSSSDGKMFRQTIGPIEPTEVGKTAEHREYWDGRNQLTKGRLAPGPYRIVATIPAKPKPYILREEFTWSGK